jgi:GNAT superfamily N-acetyltransferase
MTTVYEWRGAFTNQEVNALHAEAFNTRVFEESGWNWVELAHRHSLGWVVAREGAELVGFVNVLWDGLVHAWLQDTMVAAKARGRSIGTHLVTWARDGARGQDASTCMWISKTTTCARSISAPAVSRLPTPGCCYSTDQLLIRNR